jgi:hypothetical protein
VPDVLRAVDGFRHAPDRDLLDDVLLFGALHILQQVVDRVRKFVSIGVAQGVAETFGQRAQLIDLLRIRQVVDAVDERAFAPFMVASFRVGACSPRWPRVYWPAA